MNMNKQEVIKTEHSKKSDSRMGVDVGDTYLIP